MNIITNKRISIGHSVDHWMRNCRNLQIELDLYQDWYALASTDEHRFELKERIDHLMQFKYDANLEMQRQRDKITPHLQPWVVETAEYQGDGYWVDHPPMEFDDEKSAREYETLVNATMQTGGQTKVRNVYQRVLA